MILTLYKALTVVGGPLIALYLSRRLAKGKEDAERFGERLGQAGLARPEGQLIWLHAASVGESVSLLPLIDRLQDGWPDRNILVTTGTVTSARIMQERLPDQALHQYLPVDRPGYVTRFLDHWRPDLVLWAESEFWPNMMSAVAKRNIQLILINGRMSPASFKTWRRIPGMIGELLSGFSLCLGQTEIDAERLRALGADNAKCLGNLKFAAPPLPADALELSRLADLFGDRPRWLAASTHGGEEDLAGRIHRTLKSRHPRVLTVIVPRHPERGPTIAADLTTQGLSVALRSLGQVVTEQTDIYVADTLGELGLFYRLCPVTLIGKSMIGQGGQNPLEPARLGCAVVIGPHMGNFQEIAAKLTSAGACVSVSDEATLGEAVSRLLGASPERDALAAAATDLAAAEDGVLDAVMDELTPYLAAGGDHART